MSLRNSFEDQPYKIIFGKACHLPIELKHRAMSIIRQLNFNLDILVIIESCNSIYWKRLETMSIKMLEFTKRI